MPPRPLPLPGLQDRAGQGGRKSLPVVLTEGKWQSQRQGHLVSRRWPRHPVPYQPGMGVHAAGSP